MDVANNNNIGSLRISQDVISTIASHTASKVPGVSSLAFAPTSVRKLFYKSTTGAQSVKFTYNDDNAVIDVYINLEYGAKIKEVAQKIQENVKEAVQNMTSVTITAVNVHVENVEFPES